MSCIKRDIIQKYIDGEATPREVALVKAHIEVCEVCVQKINRQHQLVAGVKKAINLLAEDPMGIPALRVPPSQVKKQLLTRRSIIYSLSAACILVLVFVISYNEKEPRMQNQVTIVYGLGADVDANQPITEQPMVINIIDEKGTISEFSGN